MFPVLTPVQIVCVAARVNASPPPSRGVGLHLLVCRVLGE